MTPARRFGQARIALATLGAIVFWSGCTSPREYLANGFKVGPNYCRPAAPVAENWIDKVPTREGEDLSRWWKVFNDPVLDHLILHAYRENLSLREAGFRVLQARAQRGIAVGELFPQQQNATGSYRRVAVSTTSSGPPPVPQFFDQWNAGFNLAWELDFWGRFRRAVAAADAQLDASVEGYDDVLVTLLGDVATNYVQVRTLQERIRWLRFHVDLQSVVLASTTWRRVNGTALELDENQIRAILEQTESQIPELEIQLRLAENRLCILLGMPPADLEKMIGEDHIPIAQQEVVFGIPADLLRRRPDVRRAERLAAAQAELIGIAKADLYPAFSINGTLGYQAKNFADLLSSPSLNGNVGPSIQWNILNYGRIINNVRLQDAKFQELATTYQDTVLRANEEAEDGLVTFLRAQKRTEHLDKSVLAAKSAVADIIRILPTAGSFGSNINRFSVIEQNWVQEQDQLAQSRGEIAQGLIQVYRALGGGWEIRLEALPAAPLSPAAVPSVTPEGAEDLQRLRRLLEPEPGAAPAVKPELPGPKPEARQP
jgi:NodT family efflux transporter outer membrane factor (OMF) lipoprotein